MEIRPRRVCRGRVCRWGCPFLLRLDLPAEDPLTVGYDDDGRILDSRVGQYLLEAITLLVANVDPATSW